MSTPPSSTPAPLGWMLADVATRPAPPQKVTERAMRVALEETLMTYTRVDLELVLNRPGLLGGS